ncbi:MAG: tetratricopeptide repeat protein [Hyphomicrobiaceae bacterium]|nr:tetratricopeptide repeat protein [Hyphomicrobiaceae bacterium]
MVPPAVAEAPKPAPKGKITGKLTATPVAMATGPRSVVERDRLLRDLYTRLSTASDEEGATLIAGAIEKLWLFSGSDTINVLMQRALAAVNRKDHALALRLLDSVVLLAPDFAEGWNRRAYVHFLRNDYAASLRDLRHCLALDPNHFRALDGLATVWREVGRKKAALAALRLLREVHPFWSNVKQAIDELEREVDGQKT